MAEYQNIFTQVQLKGPAYAGVPLEPRGVWLRLGKGGHSYWLGKFGDPQVGPFYLGWTGLASLLCGFIAIEIIGLNMWASRLVADGGLLPHHVDHPLVGQGL
jgi:photosynthetic reaction center M subunit